MQITTKTRSVALLSVGMLLMSASAVGQTLQVMTVLDSQSMLHDVWVLNETEVALYPTKPSYSR